MQENKKSKVQVESYRPVSGFNTLKKNDLHLNKFCKIRSFVEEGDHVSTVFRQHQSICSFPVRPGFVCRCFQLFRCNQKTFLFFSEPNPQKETKSFFL